MREDLREDLAKGDVPLLEGMLTDLGRVLEVGEETALLWDPQAKAVVEVHGSEPIPDLEDAGTYLMCLAFLCVRVGLEPSSGVLWYQSEDGDACWVLEGTDEVRTRDADTDDPLLALARALAETV